MAPEFAEQYRDGRWQECKAKRLKAMNFACEGCGEKASSGAQLDVHHTHYLRDKMLWEYEDEDLRVYCKSCHKKADKIRIKAAQLFGRMRLNVAAIALSYLQQRMDDGDVDAPAAILINIFSSGDIYHVFWNAREHSNSMLPEDRQL